ncbi:MAG TPA: thioredoxin family protein [Candidatus Babeliales bacterium]|nr:thioredoxin family protein [Candidatus Babeliales bacterium]
MITSIKKATYILSIGLCITSGISQAKMVTFDTILKNHAGKNYQRALTDAIEQAGNVLVYVGSEARCKYCKTTMDAIRKLITEFPDVLFITISSDKYPSFKSGTIPKLKFYVNGVYITVTDSQNLAQLRASLKKYYR